MSEVNAQLSIIVPVYNTAFYLERCVESLLKIHATDYEILLIDDGSTDESGEMCDRYSSRYSMIKSFHKQNGGIISSRIMGVANSCGKYIAFVDSDDWVGEDIFTDFLSAMESDRDLDVCIGGMMKAFPDGTSYHYIPPSSSCVMTNTETMTEMLLCKKFNWTLEGNIYRHSLFDEFHPPEEVVLGEDLISNFSLLQGAKKILYKPIYQYFYFTNTESVTESSIKFKSVMQAYHHVNKLGIKDRKLQDLIKTFYAKEIIRDIWCRLLYDEFMEHNLFYRNELNSLILNENVYSFYAHYFDMTDFQESLENDELFHCFWSKMFKDIIDKLRSCSSSYRKVYVYGTGIVSRFIRSIMKQHNIRYDLCVISDGQGKRGVEEKYLSEIHAENKDTVFILALASVHHADVINSLQKKGYTHFLILDIISDMYR